MKEINLLIPISISILFSFLLFIFYLYKTENDKLMRFLSYLYIKNRYKRADIQKDTRRYDAILLIALIIAILLLGIKIVYLQVVISDSMKPEFARGDIILSQTVFKDPKVGDMITFKLKDSTNVITHRIAEIKGSEIYTKGDNNPYIDDYKVDREDIVAKAIIINDRPIVIKNIGAYFILDFTKQGAISKYGDKFEFLQELFLVLRTWGYVITAIALMALIMTMIEDNRITRKYERREYNNKKI